MGKTLNEIKGSIKTMQEQIRELSSDLNRLDYEIKEAVLQERYVLDRTTLTIKKAWIEPEHEWCYMVLDLSGDKKVKIFNDMNPQTQERTGKFYREDEIFCSVEEGKEGLRTFIKKKIEANRKEIEEIEERNSRLTNALMAI
jgi:hypothetical protein